MFARIKVREASKLLQCNTPLQSVLRPSTAGLAGLNHLFCRSVHKNHTMYKESWLAFNSPSAYGTFLQDLNTEKKMMLESPRRFQRISEREDRSDLPIEVARSFTVGKQLLQFQGIPCLTGCLDLVKYYQCFEHVRPGTVFEIGALFGASALWMAQTVRMLDLNCQVFSMDIDLSQLDSRVKDLQPDNLTFLRGDCYKIEETMPPDFLKDKPHPWVIVEDAHENSFGVLEHFHKFMKEGDYIIYDDTDPEAPTMNGMGMGWKGYPEWESCGLGKMKELRRFMTKYDDYYAVDTFITDMFGYNAGNNWNGYIKRMK